MLRTHSVANATSCRLFVNVCVFVKLFRSTSHVAYLHVKMCDIGNSFYVITVLFLLVYCI